MWTEQARELHKPRAGRYPSDATDVAVRVREDFRGKCLVTEPDTVSDPDNSYWFSLVGFDPTGGSPKAEDHTRWLAAETKLDGVVKRVT